MRQFRLYREMGNGRVFENLRGEGETFGSGHVPVI